MGEKSATADVTTQFTPTHFPLPSGKLGERGERELVRNLESEQGFAHRALPMGPGLTLEANGPLAPGAEKYKKMLYEKGQSAGVGDRVVITSVTFKGDRIILDLNGGPYAKHRFLSHVSFGDAPVAQAGEPATGSRVTLVFKEGIPDISAPEVKALLTPVIDFGAKTSAQAYADTLPAQLKESIAAHEVLVGMDRRMVLAALGAPESKVREHSGDDPDGPKYEEWIYGHVPQTVRFVRFTGDRVILVKIAALGKPIEVHDKNEMGDFVPTLPTHEIAMGDGNATDSGHVAPPSLKKPGEVLPGNSANKVQFPDEGTISPSSSGSPQSSPDKQPPPAQTSPSPSSFVPVGLIVR